MELAGGDRAAGAAPHRHRARSSGPRCLGARCWGLLARGARRWPARPAGRARPRTRDARGAFARRRDRHAVRLPVPRDHRAPGAGLQRRPGSGGQPGPARRGAPGRGSVHRRHRRGGALRGSRARPRPGRCRAAAHCGQSPRSLAATRRSPTPAAGPPSSPRCARSSAWAVSASTPATGSTSPRASPSSSCARRVPGHTTEPPFVLYVPQRASQTGERCAERVVLVLSHLNRPHDQSGITSPPAGRCGTENHSHGRTLGW